MSYTCLSFEGMVNVLSKKGARDGCSKRPTYGRAKSKKAEYCVEHALEGMATVNPKPFLDDESSNEREGSGSTFDTVPS